MNQEQFRNKKQWAGDAVPSMKRRRVGHDYHGRCIYMLTLVVEGRRQLLGHVSCDGENDVAMIPSELGAAILKELGEISRHYPAIKVLSHQLMPDHLHFIVFVREPIPRHLSHVVSSFKVGCNRIYRRFRQQGVIADALPVLWEQGYNDKILEGKDYLSRMMKYIDDNPRRLALKQQHPDYFTVQSNVLAGGYTFAALGNVFLLKAPRLVQVQCTRRLTTQQINDTCRNFLNQAQNGAVLVSPAISPGEKAVMRAAFEEGFPIIILQENGFAPLAKPGGKRFDACAQGKLLLLAPWEHHNTRTAIRRQQCHALNDMAQAICSQQSL